MTGPGETSLGGSQREFPSTCWSRFRGGGNAESLETLARGYWKPIYAYVRARFGKGPEEAKDLTQDFFVWMMESGFLSHPDPAKGRFRSFVKASLHNYFLNEAREARTLKRGGDRRFVPVDAAGVALPDPAGRPPEQALDDAWRMELVGRAASKLEEESRDGLRFRLFRIFHLSAEAPPTYKDAALAQGVTESELNNTLREARVRFREIVADLVAETVGSAEDLQEELDGLFGKGWK